MPEPEASSGVERPGRVLRPTHVGWVTKGWLQEGLLRFFGLLDAGGQARRGGAEKTGPPPGNPCAAGSRSLLRRTSPSPSVREITMTCRAAENLARANLNTYEQGGSAREKEGTWGAPFFPQLSPLSNYCAAIRSARLGPRVPQDGSRGPKKCSLVSKREALQLSRAPPSKKRQSSSPWRAGKWSS